eukprot:TRINITY_DN6146_c0_g1_i1.p1 TRINITY_DN6146_c0_g1~~TRINITY_DN6146_c0_g1_i1.p1  ORF type:complete len:1449 (+),score=295.84 TRINITY_DN6146_c0_g1_i1:53-4399(+)
MALFFNFKTQPPQPNVKACTLGCAWHQEVALLAVATDNGQVTIYNEEGDKYDPNLTIQRSSSNCSCLIWHPKLRLLVMGWRDGALEYWSEEHGRKEATPVHSDHVITTLQWHPNGTRLVSADKSGQLGVWKLDAKNVITPMIQYKKSAAITHVAFRTPKRQADGTERADGTASGGGDLVAEDIGDDAVADTSNVSTKHYNKQCLFFFGGDDEVIYMGDDNGNMTACTARLESPIAALLYNPNKDGVVCMTTSMQLAYWGLDANLGFQQITKVKVASTQTADFTPPQVMWVGANLLVTSNNESVLRLWNLEKDESYLLHLAEQEDATVVTTDPRRGMERISCVAFNPRKRVIAGGTREGRIVFWQFVGADPSVAAEDWEAFAEIDLDTGIGDIAWGPGENLLSASMQDSVSILHETVLKRKLANGVALIQLSPECVFVEIMASKSTHTVKSGLRIKGLDMTDSHFCVWNGKFVELYQIGEGSITLQSQFEAPATCVCLHSDCIFVAKHDGSGAVVAGAAATPPSAAAAGATGGSMGRIEVLSLQGAHKKQTLTLPENEGSPLFMDVHGDFLAVATSRGFVRMWRIGREVKPHGFVKQVFAPESGVDITSIKVNCDGSRVSLLAKVRTAAGHTTTDSRLYVYDFEVDRLRSYSFEEVSRYPISHCWDETEPKLLGCETRRFRSGDANDEDTPERSSRIEVATLFASPDKGVVLQDSFPLDKNVTALVGLAVPNLYFYARFVTPTEADARETHIEVKPMPNFDGINVTDPKVKEALLNFSYYLTIGNMDDAYKSVKTIKDENVWHNMAVMCVKTKRLDVAEVCLGNIQDAKAARALREARSEPEVEARVAMLAIHLNRIPEAERLYKHCKRYDLLNRMYQACGKWDLALQTAEKFDRIHLRTIHYNNARHYEAVGDVDGAIREYEQSKNHRYEVPRMLFDHGLLPQLETYILNSHDKDLMGWWAQYNESNAHFEAALTFYEQADDTLSRVRLLCFMNRLEAAAELVSQTGHGASAYHLARQYEEQGMVKEAIQYFTAAKAYKHAIKIAKENDLDAEVMNLALSSGSAGRTAASRAVMIDAAEYFETKGKNDHAVVLFQKGGDLTRSIALCVRAKLFDVLTSIADTLEEDAEPEVFIRCADFFVEHQKFDKAALMFINAKAYERALQLCIEHNVPLTEPMAEKMTLPKSEDEEAEAYRISLLKKIAKVAKAQECWHLACKKYTQAGDKLKAMKVLLRSGDKEKIIFFASHSRQKEIYVLAANFLQNLDWHADPEIMKNIISFYTKAHAVESLATFYDACAQVEIDEYRDYGKALGALKDAQRYLVKSKLPDKDRKAEQLRKRIELVEQFVQARELVGSRPDEMIRMCQALLDDPEIDSAIRVGDIYALLVEFYSSQRDMQHAYGLIEKMRDKGIVLSYYLEQSLIENVYRAVGVEYEGNEADHGIGEEIPED